jgi:hypothetical protein
MDTSYKLKDLKIHYLIDKDGNKLLPYEYYNKFKYISIPMVGKKCLIKEWQKKTKTVHPNYINENIGLLTGKNNNLTVLDIDVKDNGMILWNIITKLYPTIKTPTVKSPGGSIHLYFKYNNKIPNMNRIKLKQPNIKINNNTINLLTHFNLENLKLKRIGWDIKNDGSIITSPPSVYPSLEKNNLRYKFIDNLSFNDIKPITMPNWLEEFIINNIK